MTVIATLHRTCHTAHRSTSVYVDSLHTGSPSFKLVVKQQRSRQYKSVEAIMEQVESLSEQEIDENGRDVCQDVLSMHFRRRTTGGPFGECQIERLIGCHQHESMKQI